MHVVHTYKKSVQYKQKSKKSYSKKKNFSKDVKLQIEIQQTKSWFVRSPLAARAEAAGASGTPISAGARRREGRTERGAGRKLRHEFAESFPRFSRNVASVNIFLSKRFLNCKLVNQSWYALKEVTIFR